MERLGQHPGTVLVEQDYTATVHVRIKLDRPVEFAHDEVGESDRSPVQRAACVDHAAIPAVGSAHVLTVAPKWNDGQGLTVASRRGAEVGDSRRTG